ncbi:uncharacterized protein LOC129313051 [Prosopis cineraria]|uniref:uncharacterized protein LOC129313051 n=1 Tax=Prosopis cineraria TaxID=364024 RepID=UPI00240FE030|nr:uncharacterized protein LOC129313051 [Prosopis cineraria]XP_054811854.1 uncharacterized protein LOC129313051 [Prosopis cineraria]
MTQNADMRRESGTCNVCSAPCSSCMHFNRACMGSKVEFSDENCHLAASNQYSMEEGDISSLRSKAHESIQHTDMLSINSSHDSLSENADSKQTLSSKCQESKYLEGLDDNTSCISRASDGNLANSSHPNNADRRNVSCSSASVNILRAEGFGSAHSFDLSGLPEIPPRKDVDTGESSPKEQSHDAKSQSVESHSTIPRLMDVERDAPSLIPEKSECFTENTDSSSRKVIATSVVSGEKPLAVKDNLIDGSSTASLKIYPKSEADAVNEVGSAPDEACNVAIQDEQDKAEEPLESPGMEEPQSEDESDESDVVEHDVKVCDICGDAGREDLLAICSRCSDGAEHTYCMREMLQKVPEGDWLCEECKYAEAENQRLDVEERKIPKVSSTSQHFGKRLSENIELAPVPKRQALESSSASPKSSSPKRTVVLSQESSLKSSDKGKLKPDNQMPIRNHSGSDNTETVRSPPACPRGLLRKGMLLKSNSFNALNSKPRVKPVDEVVPQKLKGPGENTSKNMETPSRMIGKSMSFKSTSLGRSSTTASKVKLLSSNSVPAQDLKGTRPAKDSSAFDRKSLSRVDRPVVCSTMATSVVSTPKGDLKSTTLSETIKPLSVSNNRDLKVNQDGKLSTLSKSISNVGRKGVEPQVCSGRICTSGDESVQDMQPRLRETANPVEKTRDSSSDRVRIDAIATSKGCCQKCKEFGHATECCTIGKTQESGNEVSFATTSSSIEEMHKSDNVKAALQAALLRMPEIHKKKEVANQMDELGTDLKFEATAQEQVLVSGALKNSISAEEIHNGQDTTESSAAASLKGASDEKLLNLTGSDSCSQLENSGDVVPSIGKIAVGDFPNQPLAISRVLSKMAVPEYEHIWQGIFELHRSGKPPDLCSGIQAHLSTCASLKVLEVVNKLPSKIPLSEVPRASTWPSQFHQGGAKENNIALYFFAEDIESHEKHYGALLDHMMRNDLALKGIFDGVELLIFPSNQLPQKSQRWNMLFFLWGVFRGRRINYSDSAEKTCIPSLNMTPAKKDVPTAIMTVSEIHCSPKRMDEESIPGDRTCMVLPSTSLDQNRATVSRNFDVKESNLDETQLGSQINIEEQDCEFDTKPTSSSLARGAQFSQELKSTGSSMKGSSPEHGRESEPSPGAMRTNATSRFVETKVDPGISVKQEKSLPSGIPSLGSQEICVASTASEDKFSVRMAGDSYQQRHEKKQKDNQYIDLETAFQGDLTVEGVNLMDTALQTSAVTCKRLWSEADVKLEDGEKSSKKLKTDDCGAYGCGSSGGRDSYRNNFASHANDLGAGSSIEDKGCDEICDEKIILEDSGRMERTFFPVDARNVNDSHLGPNSSSLKGPHVYDDQSQDELPNLELALGGEMKPPHKGMLPFFVGEIEKKHGQEKPPDCLADELEDDGDAASLSLSLSFPSSNKERVKTVSKAEQLLPDGRHVNTSLLLFGRFADK